MIRIVTLLLLIMGSTYRVFPYTISNFTETESLAKKGDIEAMLKLGEYYLTINPSTLEDAKKAASWFKKAMDKGSVTGRFRYAEIMANGSTGKVYYKEAIKAVTGISNDSVAQKFYNAGVKAKRQVSGQALLYCAATMGNNEALYELALLYEDNAMLIKKEWEQYNIIKAIQLMEDAGHRNFIPAVNWVIDAYSTKRKEPENVMKWKNRLNKITANQVDVKDAVFAQDHGDTQSIAMIYALLSQNGSYKDNILLAEDAATMLTRLYYKNAVQSILINIPMFQNPEDYIRLKKIIKDNNIDVNDYSNIILIGVENGDMEMVRSAARLMIGKYSFRPDSRDIIENLLKESANAGNSEDALLLGDELRIVYPTDDRLNEAVKYYSLSKSEYATQELARIAYNNKNKGAFECIKQRANNSDGDAQGWLGIMYAYGINVNKDLKEARKWLDRAQQNGKSKYKQEHQFVYMATTPSNQGKQTHKKPTKTSSGIEFQQSKVKR